jgi:hypothetical protein
MPARVRHQCWRLYLGVSGMATLGIARNAIYGQYPIEGRRLIGFFTTRIIGRSHRGGSEGRPRWSVPIYSNRQPAVARGCQAGGRGGHRIFPGKSAELDSSCRARYGSFLICLCHCGWGVGRLGSAGAAADSRRPPCWNRRSQSHSREERVVNYRPRPC